MGRVSSRNASLALQVLLLIEAAVGEPGPPFDHSGKGPTRRCGKSAAKGTLHFFQAVHCTEECPIATKPASDLCHSVCVSSTEQCLEVNPESTLYNASSQLCIACPIANCKTCELDKRGQAICQKCSRGFRLSLIDEEYLCVLPFEQLLDLIVKYTLYGIAGLMAMLFVCFGGMRHFVGKEAHIFLKHLHLIHESDEYNTLSDKQESETAMNVRALKYGLMMAYQSSMDKAQQRRKHRVQKARHDDRKKCNPGWWWRWFKKQVWLQTSANQGIAMTLFFNTQKFFIVLTGLLWGLQIIMREYTKVDAAFTCLNVTKDVYNECCGSGGDWVVNESAKLFGDAMIQFCAAAWLLSMAITLSFCVYQKQVVSNSDRGHKRKRRGPLEQDYTMRLENVPSDITSELELHKAIEEKLFMDGKIHGVSIVYDIKGETEEEKKVEEAIKKMIDNLVVFDTYQRASDSALRKLFTRHRSGIEIGNQVEQDAHEFLKMLKGKGEYGDRPIKGSGEAYVVFKKKKDLRMALSTIKAFQFPTKDDPYHLVDVLPCSFTSREVLWNMCVSRPPEIRLNVVKSSIKMFIFFVLMVLCSYGFFQFVVWPYHEAGSDPTKTSKGFKYLGYVVSTFNSNIPGLVPGLALGCGFTRMGQVDNFIFIFAMTSVLLMNFLSIMSYVDLSHFKLFIEHASPRDLVSESAVVDTLFDVMYPGLTIWGYVEGEVLLALYTTLQNALFIALIYIFGMFPDRCREWLKTSVLGFKDRNKFSAREAEQAMQFQPFFISLEYSFMIWIPTIYFLSFFLFSQTSDDCCRSLFFFSLLYRFWQYINVHVFRETSMDSEETFCTTMYFFGIVLQVFPACACWWSIRLEIVNIKVGVIFLVALPLLGFSLYLRALDKMEFWHMHHTTIQGGLGADDLNTVDARDKGYEYCLNLRVFSWWNTNPVYVLKHRFCPRVPGFECMPDDRPYWPEGAVESLAEEGVEFKITKSGGHSLNSYAELRRQSTPDWQS